MPCRSSPPSRTGRLRDRVTQHARGRTGTSHATAPGRRRAGRPAHRRAAVRSRAEEVVRAVTGGGHHHPGPVQPGDRGEVEGPDVGSREQGAVLVPLDRRLHRCDAERGRTTPAAAARRPPCEPAAPSDTRCPRGRPSAAHWAVSNTRLSRPSSSRSRTNGASAACPHNGASTVDVNQRSRCRPSDGTVAVGEPSDVPDVAQDPRRPGRPDPVDGHQLRSEGEHLAERPGCYTRVWSALGEESTQSASRTRATVRGAVAIERSAPLRHDRTPRRTACTSPPCCRRDPVC